MPLEIQKSKLDETINVDKEQNKSINLSEWEVIEKPQQENAPARNEPIPVNIQDSEQVFIEGAVEQEAQAVAPKYIGFSQAYTQAESKDSERMKAIRADLQDYFKAKELLEMAGQDKLMVLNKVIFYLEKLKASCDRYCFFRHTLFSYGSQRKEEVIALRKEAKKELQERRREYSELADKWTEDNANVDPNLKKRFRPEGKVREIKLAEKKGDLRKLNFDDYTLLDGTEYDAHIEKTYFKNKSKYDLKRTDIKFTSEEKNVLNEILAYSETEFALRNPGYRAHATYESFVQGMGWKNWPRLSFFVGLVANAATNTKNLWRFFFCDGKNIKAEISSYQKIMPALKKILDNPDLSAEKRQVFLAYQKRLLSFEGGKLKTDDIPEDEIRDYTNIQRFTLSRQLKASEIKAGGPKTKEDAFLYRSNRKDEPLFVHTPCMSDIVQYAHGNCFALAAIASVVSKDPNAILNMFKDEGERGVVVKLWRRDPGQPMKPVYYRVDKIVSDFENQGALWVNVLMNAIVAHRQDFPDEWDRQENDTAIKERIQQQKEAGIKELDFGVVACGGFSSEVFPILTGRPFEEASNHKGSVYESESTDNILDQVYQESAPLEERKKWVETGEVLQKDFATYILVRKDGARVHVEHHKELFDNLVSGLRASHEEVLKKIRENEEKKITASEPIRKRWELFLDAAKKKYQKEYNEEMSDEKIKYLRKIFDENNHGEDYHRIKNPEEYGGRDFLSFIGYYVSRDFLREHDGMDYYDAKREVEKLTKANAELLQKFYKEKGMKDLEERQKEALRLSWTLDKAVRDEDEAKKVFDKELMNIESYFTEAGNVVFAKKSTPYTTTKKEWFKAHLETIKTLTADDFPEPEDKYEKKDDIFNKLAEKTGKTRNECIELAKETCIRDLEKGIASYDNMFKSKQLEYFSGVYSDEALEMYNKVKNSLDKGLNVAVGSRKGMGSVTGRGETKDKGTVGYHAYTVLGVAEVTFNGTPVKMVKLRNPWSTYTTGYYYNEETKKVEVQTELDKNTGIFMMELTHFWRVFEQIYTTQPDQQNQPNQP